MKLLVGPLSTIVIVNGTSSPLHPLLYCSIFGRRVKMHHWRWKCRRKWGLVWKFQRPTVVEWKCLFKSYQIVCGCSEFLLLPTCLIHIWFDIFQRGKENSTRYHQKLFLLKCRYKLFFTLRNNVVFLLTNRKEKLHTYKLVTSIG